MNFNYKFLLTTAVISLIGNSFATEQNTLNVAAPDATQPAVVAQQDVTKNNQPVHKSAETSSESSNIHNDIMSQIASLTVAINKNSTQIANGLKKDVQDELKKMETTIKHVVGNKYVEFKLKDGSTSIISPSTVSKNKDLDEFSQENKNVLEEKVQKINERNRNIIDIVMGNKEQASTAA